MKKPNLKSFSICAMAAFVFIFVYEFIIHGILLMPLYEQTIDLWRPAQTMQEPQFFGLSLLTQITVTIISLFIFVQNFEGKGLYEGLRFGILIGLFMAVMMASSYIWMPIPATLGLAWFASGLIKGLGIGAIYGLLYKNNA